MMKSLVFSLLCLLNLSIFASGPSYERYETDTASTYSSETESLACKLARVSALDSVMGTEDDYYDNQGSCTYKSEPEVVSSTCSCKAEENEFKCEYNATVICYEEVWYN